MEQAGRPGGWRGQCCSLGSGPQTPWRKQLPTSTTERAWGADRGPVGPPGIRRGYSLPATWAPTTAQGDGQSPHPGPEVPVSPMSRVLVGGATGPVLGLAASLSIHPCIHSLTGEPWAVGVAKHRTRLQRGGSGPRGRGGGGAQLRPGSSPSLTCTGPTPPPTLSMLTHSPTEQLTQAPSLPRTRRGRRDRGQVCPMQGLWDWSPRPPEMPGFMRPREGPGVDVPRGGGARAALQPIVPLQRALALRLSSPACELGALPAVGVGSPQGHPSPVC